MRGRTWFGREHDFSGVEKLKVLTALSMADVMMPMKSESRTKLVRRMKRPKKIWCGRGGKRGSRDAAEAEARSQTPQTRLWRMTHLFPPRPIPTSLAPPPPTHTPVRFSADLQAGGTRRERTVRIRCQCCRQPSPSQRWSCPNSGYKNLVKIEAAGQ